jgi:hypothetical protein
MATLDWDLPKPQQARRAATRGALLFCLFDWCENISASP